MREERLWPAAVLPALVALAVYLPVLRSGLTGEDVGLLRGAAQTPVLGVLASGRTASNPYWRPLWHLLQKGVVLAGGGDPLGCASYAHAASLLLHAANACLVFWIGRACLRNGFSAAVAGILFALSPGPVASVAWFAAVNKELTALFGFGAVLGALRFGANGGSRSLAVTLALGALALGSSELSYGLLPVLALAACASAPARAPGLRRAAALLAPLGAAAVAVVLLAQPSRALERGIPSGGPLAILARILENEAGYVSTLAGGPTRPGGIVIAVLCGAVLSSALLGRNARFSLAWLLLAPFPTVLTSVSAFHAALAAGPFSILAARALAGERPRRGRRALAAAALALAAYAWVPAVRREVRGWERHSNEVLQFAREVSAAAPDLSSRDVLRLSNVPISFDGALAAVSGGSLPAIFRVQFLEAPRACFLPSAFAWPDPGDRRVFEFARGADGRTRQESAQSRCVGKSRVEGALVFYDALPVRNGEEALRRIASGEVDPSRTLLVETDLALPCSEAASGAAETLGVEFLADRLVVRIRVRADRPGLVVFLDPSVAAFPDPRQALLDRDSLVVFPRGFATVDGKGAPFVRAHALYRAAPVPEGEHEVVLTYTL